MTADSSIYLYSFLNTQYYYFKYTTTIRHTVSSSNGHQYCISSFLLHSSPCSLPSPYLVTSCICAYAYVYDMYQCVFIVQ